MVFRTLVKVLVILKLKDGSNSYVPATSLDSMDWLTAENWNSREDNTAAWRDLNFSIDIGAFGEVPLGDYDIYLKINDPKEYTVFASRYLEYFPWCN